MSNIPIKQQFSRGSLEKARPASEDLPQTPRDLGGADAVTGNDRQEASHEPT